MPLMLETVLPYIFTESLELIFCKIFTALDFLYPLVQLYTHAGYQVSATNLVDEVCWPQLQNNFRKSSSMCNRASSTTANIGVSLSVMVNECCSTALKQLGPSEQACFVAMRTKGARQWGTSWKFDSY